MYVQELCWSYYENDGEEKKRVSVLQKLVFDDVTATETMY